MDIVTLVKKTFALFGIILTATAAEAGSISGSLILPDPYVQNGDMQVWIRARSTSTTIFDQQQRLLTITQAQAVPGASINFTVDGLIDGDDYQLRYDCQSFTFPEPCMDIVGTAHYQAGNPSVLRAAEATLISGSDDTTGIQLPILTGLAISGVFHLPDSQTAPPGGLIFGVRAATQDNPFILRPIRGILNEGESSKPYRFTIPDDSSESWILSYECTPGGINPNGACDDYIPKGYFNSSATNSTVEFIDQAELLSGNQSRPNTDMTALDSYFISGALSLPFAPAGVDGLEVRVSARDINVPSASYGPTINIAQGETSSPYRIRVPRTADADWEISYSCQSNSTPVECANYISRGYFDSDTNITMTSTRRIDADLLAGGQSHQDIDFSVLAGIEISGSLRLSQGVAPSGGIRFFVFAINSEPNGATGIARITIPAGARETTYKLTVDPAPTVQWLLQFDCDQGVSPICLEIADTGFYDAATGQTVEDRNNAIRLMGGQNHNNINLLVESSALPSDDFCFPIKARNGAVVAVCL